MVKSGKKETKARNIIESPEVIVSSFDRARGFFDTHKRKFLAAVALLLLGLSALFFYHQRRESLHKTSQAELFQAVYYFEEESFEKALAGDGNSLGFLSLMEEYEGTPTAMLAAFYAGTIYLKQQDFEKALLYLSKFEGRDLLIQARAYALQGDAHMELAAYDKAIDCYEKAAAWHANKYFSPIYLSKMCVAHEKSGDLPATKACYQQIVDAYFGTSEHKEATKELARLSALE